MKFKTTVALMMIAPFLLVLPVAAGCTTGTTGTTGPSSSTPVSTSAPTTSMAGKTTTPYVIGAGLVEVAGTATEVAGNNFSMNTAAGPLVLKFDGATVVVRAAGSMGTMGDIRPGMTVKVIYDPATKVSSRIEIQ